MAVTDIINDVVNGIVGLVAPTSPPNSSLFILGISFAISLASALFSRRMIDIDKLERLTRETKAYQRMKKQMIKTADSKMKLKYERNADRMRKMQSELTMMNFKPMLFMMIPLMFFFAVFSGYYTWSIEEGIDGLPILFEGSKVITGNIPAVIPFSLPEAFIFPFGQNGYVEGWGHVYVPNYVWWYFGGSITFGAIFRKVFKIQPDIQ